MFTPPPPAQAQPQPGAPAEASTLPDPPAIGGDPSVAAPPPISATMPPSAEPPKPTAQPKKGTVAASPPKVIAPPASAAPTPDPPAPKIGQIFTPAQSREYNRSLNEYLGRVKKALSVVAGKTLNAEQSELVNRIRIFQKQAEQAREQDLVTAVSLARRADLLAQDLLQHLP